MSEQIDLTNEELLSLPETARRLPPGRSGKTVHLSTIMRWILRGVRGLGGKPVRLEAIRLGGRWLTSVEALQRFVAAQTPDLDSKPNLPRTATARERASERAGSRLSRIGI